MVNTDSNRTDQERIATLGVCGLREVAHYFQALADQNRLRLIWLLREKRMRSKDLAAKLNTSNANVSRHLAMLERQGIVGREGRAYFLADEIVWVLLEVASENRRQDGRPR